jgi:hypothetical protein
MTMVSLCSLFIIVTQCSFNTPIDGRIIMNWYYYQYIDYSIQRYSIILEPQNQHICYIQQLQSKWDVINSYKILRTIYKTKPQLKYCNKWENNICKPCSSWKLTPKCYDNVQCTKVLTCNSMPTESNNT